jgi:hypothetical protein
VTGRGVCPGSKGPAVHSRLTPFPAAAIVVPTPTLELDADEEVSFRQLRGVLGAYDTYLALPDDLDGTLDGLPVKRFAAPYFRGPKRRNQQLMISPDFYRAFEDYEFLLVYQLDSLVLSDELASWCEAGWDNVGAPWTRRAPEGSIVLIGVGNGGFALRRVESCLRVATTARRPLPLLRTLAWFGGAVGRRFVAHLPRTVGTIARSRRKVRAAAAMSRGALASTFLTEDKFWSEMAPRLDSTFRIPPVETALRFAFESHPRECFELNRRRLPFGCHKWWFYDRVFWEPYLIRTTAATRDIST